MSHVDRLLPADPGVRAVARRLYDALRELPIISPRGHGTVFSRELAPLAGFYPSVYVGAPWWFLDAPEAARRWRSAVTESAGLTTTSGFIDDPREFCSIPARDDDRPGHDPPARRFRPLTGRATRTVRAWTTRARCMPGSTRPAGSRATCCSAH